jgi:DNA (cytosine-5)-methyltransferase 1
MLIKIGSDFSGVGAFDQALQKIGVDYETVFACDWDKYARQTYIENYGEPDYYPKNVYHREIPQESLDIYMTSPPCQAFSLAGQRKGEDDDRGVLFYNSHEFIEKNKPRYFIFENVKGLLSDAKGKTFQIWLDMLGGKSVNGNPVIFPREDAVPYHVYWKVLNAKNYGVPQNRERVFIIGIRDDQDNNFYFPKEQHLTKRLKDVLENNVDEKYFLSEKMIDGFISSSDRHNKKGTGFQWNPKTEDDLANCLRANGALCKTDNSIKVKSATTKGYEEAQEGNSINLTFPESETRRGRVGKGVAQTLDTQCNQGLVQLNNPIHSNNRIYSDVGCSPTLNTMQGGNRQPFTKISETSKIRRLTPRECFRLMDFPDSFTWPVSDTQAYKQAGNSIVVNVLAEILKKMKLE